MRIHLNPSGFQVHQDREIVAFCFREVPSGIPLLARIDTIFTHDTFSNDETVSGRQRLVW